MENPLVHLGGIGMGDSQAGRLLVSDRDMQTRIYGWAHRLLQNHDDALDATQEVMMRALRATQGPIEKPAAWLRRITINYCLDALRSRRGFAPLQETAATTAGDPVADRELRDRIAGGLDKLSEHQRAALVAKVYDGETFAAIAESMGLSVSTVKTHYVRALRVMREALGE